MPPPLAGAAGRAEVAPLFSAPETCSPTSASTAAARTSATTRHRRVLSPRGPAVGSPWERPALRRPVPMRRSRRLTQRLIVVASTLPQDGSRVSVAIRATLPGGRTPTDAPASASPPAGPSAGFPSAGFPSAGFPSAGPAALTPSGPACPGGAGASPRPAWPAAAGVPGADSVAAGPSGCEAAVAVVSPADGRDSPDEGLAGLMAAVSFTTSSTSVPPGGVRPQSSLRMLTTPTAAKRHCSYFGL